MSSLVANNIAIRVNPKLDRTYHPIINLCVNHK